MNSECLARYQQTPCYPCEQYEESQGNPRCSLGVPSFPLIRCGHYEYTNEPGDDDNELEVE